MNIHVKTLLTMAVLGVLIVLGVAWGWSSLTSPFPHHAAAKACTKTRLHTGDRVTPSQVIVSIFNASQRSGLAESTAASFQLQGFALGNIGNAPQGAVVHYAQIWTSDRTNPAVRLVASRLGPRASIVDKKHGGGGVIVLIGPRFQQLLKGRPSVKVAHATTICVPPGG